MKNIKWHSGQITKAERNKILGFKNKVLWFTGLSGSGKSTIAGEIEKKLIESNKLCYSLDGDNIRHGLNSDLGFSRNDRKENIRRIALVSKLFYDAGLHVIVSFISPYISDRKFARSLIGEDFIEIYVKCSLEVCEKRDPKGLYKKARAGVIKGFTGIDDPYEAPVNPEIILESDKLNIEESFNIVLNRLNA